MEIKETLGVLLERRLLREYDEKLLFFTEDLGKTLFFSYGSKSPRSKRKAVLASPALSKITYQRKGAMRQLIELNRIAEIGNNDNPEGRNAFMRFLRIFRQTIPSNAPDKELFNLLKNLILQDAASREKDFLDLLLPALFLTQQGVLATILTCSNCHRLCSSDYRLLEDALIIGEQCPEVNERMSSGGTRSGGLPIPLSDKKRNRKNAMVSAKEPRTIFSFSASTMTLVSRFAFSQPQSVKVSVAHQLFNSYLSDKKKRVIWQDAAKLCNYAMKNY